jgi:hypothetical protein
MRFVLLVEFDHGARRRRETVMSRSFSYQLPRGPSKHCRISYCNKLTSMLDAALDSAKSCYTNSSHTHTHTHTQSHVTNHNNDIIVFPFSMFATLGICEELRKNFYKRQTDRCVSKFQQVQHHKRNTLPINSTPQITPSVGESILSCIFDNDNSFTSNPSNPGVAGILSCIESSTGLALL